MTWERDGVAVLVVFAAFAAALLFGFIADNRERKLQRKVFANLDSAYDNDYFAEGEYLHGACAGVIACDLRAFAEDMYPYKETKLAPHVQAWLLQKGLA